MSSATPSTNTVETALRTTLATTWPPNTAAPLTSIERKRSMMPVVMSLHTLTAVIAEPNPAQRTSTPGTT